MFCYVASLGFSSYFAMAASQTAKEALRAWLNLLSPEERRIAEATMGASMPASEAAPDEPTKVDTHADPTVPHSQADPSTTPIPEEPNLTFLAQQEWYDSQDKIFQGPTPPDTPWQDDDLSAQPSSSASAQPIASQQKTSPQAPDAEAWLLPKPDTCLFNIFGESFQLRDIKEKIAKGQMPHCLYKDPKAAGEQPLNRQEMWAAMQFKPIYRTAGRWTYYDLLPDDIRKPPPQFCDEIEDAPLLPPASRLQPKEKARPKHVPPSARPTLTPKSPQKDSWADATEEEAASQPAPPTKPQPAQPPKPTTETTLPTEQPTSSTTEQKSEPPPQQHLRPPESHSFLPKDSEPLPKPMPKKPSKDTPQPQGQPQTRPRCTSLRADRILTWTPFAASINLEPPLGLTSSTSAYSTTEPNHSTATHTSSLLSV